MFDSVTVELISSAPPLEDLDLSELPQILTEAYTRIVSARIRLRESADENSYHEDFVEIIHNMKRLAFTQEALVSVLAERENRAAAAFVGGTAHYISLLAEKIRPEESRPSYLSYQAISPEVSATLLFMIAEASADAAEMAKSIIVQTEDAVEAALLTAISDLAKGKLRALIERNVPSSDQFLNTDLCSQAVRTLYYLLLQGTRLLAATMLGEDINEDDLIETEPKALFDQIKSLCIESFDMGLDDKKNIQYSLYPGPLHL
ncbi:MAG: RNA helicase, partial [Methylobacter sp.]